MIPYFQLRKLRWRSAGNLTERAPRIRFDGNQPPEGLGSPRGLGAGDELILETSSGRATFNEQRSTDYLFVNEVAGKQLGNIVNTLTLRYPNVPVADCLTR